LTIALTIVTTPGSVGDCASTADRGDHGRRASAEGSAQEKAAIVAEGLAERAVVSEVARRHGLSLQQVFGWRARLRDAVKDPTPSSDATSAFVPAIVEDEPPSPAASALPAVVAMGAAGGTDPAPIEIGLGGATRSAGAAYTP
jgi:transposase